MAEAAAKFRNFAWTGQRLRAAELLAEDELTDLVIAETVGISDRQLRNWKQHPEFRAKVEELTLTLERAMLRFAIAKRRKRIERQNADWQRLDQMRRERAVDPTMQHIPGASTGLIVRRYKAIGTGRDQQVVEEYEVDTALLNHLLALEKHTAQELGQWTEKSENKHEMLVREYVGVNVDEV